MNPTPHRSEAAARLLPGRIGGEEFQRQDIQAYALPSRGDAHGSFTIDRVVEKLEAAITSHR
jgi:hypothetical protein